MASERVQKILAQAGIASRRKAEELIREGQVTINGKIAQLGDKAELGKDSIKVRGKLLVQTESPVYVAFYKPRGVISALSDPESRPSLGEFTRKIKARVFPVGRLDFNSEGLLLLTNDGAFAEKFQKSDQIPRVYSVKVKGHSDAEMISRIERGARIGEKFQKLLKPFSVRVAQRLANKTMIEVVVMGAGAFDVKALFEARGFLVEKIVRTALGHLTLRGLEPGKFRYLKASQVLALLEQPELAMRILKKKEDEYVAPEPARIRPTQDAEPKSAGRSKIKPKRAEKQPERRPESRITGTRIRPASKRVRRAD